ncbi:MAG: DNA mismatch repair protein MutS [Muribaculaceae bacterium]|nr:DNA mismatch repair protein MutS [Muribaculaceae bacterium]
MAKPVETPLMKQYYEMKKKHPDAILLFRVGDFYETFSDDAKEASAILGITLTRRANGSAQYVELAGFPHHALDTYLPRLVREGKRVAICEQLEDPKTTKKLVKRGIIELVTPGVNISSSQLEQRDNNFLAAIHRGKNAVGVAFLDITTGEYLCAQGTAEYVDKLLNNIRPSELLRLHGSRLQYEADFTYRCSSFELDDWVYTTQAAEERLLRHFSTASLKGFGVQGLTEAVIAAGSILYYLDQTCHTQIGHITALARIEEDKYVRLDRFTTRNLEIVEPMSPEGMSLYRVLDHTVTPMGARLLHRHLLFPLLDIEAINKRLDAVEYFLNNPEQGDAARDVICTVGDFERFVSRVATLRTQPRDMLSLRNGLAAGARLKKLLTGAPAEVIRDMAARIDPLDHLVDTITRTVSPDAPSQLGKGPAIAAGVDPELDELRNLVTHGKEALAAIQQREIERTGIPSLKISFNNVFGYYIEVRNTHKDKVPAEWIRKQTLTAAERYITEELKEYEEKITGAEQKIDAIERRIFDALVEHTSRYIPAMKLNALLMAQTDVVLSHAVAASEYNYTRPVIDDSTVLEITEGRHPVIERRLPPGEPYIANSLTLDCDETQVMIITGPNMSGKSALLRQTALITLMAQTGCYVPAQKARIGLVDKIFTRVGASDNISSGESTFMVEMNEAASILNNMSGRSLILFDELGRGTSTYDGISIAWAIVEYIHDNGRCRPRTLFATHYHELNEMEHSLPRVRNYHVAVQEIDGKVVFLRKLRQGGSEHSFGIHVARLAGMPPSIVKRADSVLRGLESSHADASPGSANANAADKKSRKKAAPEPMKANIKEIGKQKEGMQLSIFQLDDPTLSQVRKEILNLDIDNLTPLQALTSLHNLKSLLTGK